MTLRAPTPLLGMEEQAAESALEERLLPPSHSGQPLAREELLPSRHFLGEAASPCPLLLLGHPRTLPQR